jgi:signal transduction histidine kinase
LERILVVDDDESTCRSLSLIFNKAGYETETADTAREAIEKAKVGFFNVALLDIKLPDMDGIELLPLLKQMHPDMVEIMVTGHASLETAVQALDKEASAYITKPMNMDEVMVAVQEALEKQRLVIEKRSAEEALRKAHDELERRVEERTADLVIKNEQLRREMEERKRLAKVLTQNEKLKTLGAVAAEVAHEIRNPLVCIGGFARRLQKKSPDLQECDIILKESQRLEKILARIRNYLKPVKMLPQKCCVNTIITGCVELMSPETERRRVMCRLDLDPRLPAAYLDPEILSQILLNLIRNASEAMDKGGILIIKTFENDQNLHIEIKNRATGPKIKNSELLFMPFAEGGQSIGLPLCYRLLTDMGGLLSFTQEKDFMVVTVSLPKTVQAAQTKGRGSSQVD